MKAYPFIHKHPTTGNTTMAEGMDLRDYFAARAMQGLVISKSFIDLYSAGATAVAQQAYLVADAMMKQREVKHDQP